MTDAQQTVADARRLMTAVEQSLVDGEARLRALGIDPAKVRALRLPLRAEQQRELDEAVAADRAAIEQEVAEGRARLLSGQPSAAGGKLRGFV